MSFSGKVVLVTGASSGIGAATAILFAKEGANVAMVGRNDVKLKNIAEEVRRVGKDPLVIIADVADDDKAKSIIKQTVDKFGKLDVLVNNAGFGKKGNILEGTVLKSYDDTMSVNVRAVVHLTMLAAPHLVATKGNIVNISSIAGMTTQIRPDYMSYGLSKAALDHFTRGSAAELAPKGVRVNAINPGPVATDILKNSGISATWEAIAKTTPLQRVSEPHEIAELIIYVASEKAKSITGSTYVIDNGSLLQK